MRRIRRLPVIWTRSTSAVPTAWPGLPSNYTFTAADAGSHTFTGLTLKTAGSQSITSTDTTSSADWRYVHGLGDARRGKPFGIPPIADGRSGGRRDHPGGQGRSRGRVQQRADQQLHGPGDAEPGHQSQRRHSERRNARPCRPESPRLEVSRSISPEMGTRWLPALRQTSSGVTSLGFTVTTNTLATHLSVSAPSSSNAGNTFSITVSALTSANTTASSYLGTVHFSSSDALAGLPANYTFTPTDAGSHTFSGLTLKTAGSQTITAADTSSSAASGTATVSVAAGVANHLVFLPIADGRSGGRRGQSAGQGRIGRRFQQRVDRRQYRPGDAEPGHQFDRRRVERQKTRPCRAESPRSAICR